MTIVDMEPQSNGHPILLGLSQVAAWKLPTIAHTPIKADLPSLQRGPVWKPDQVELLWDSILNGFPIGSFVVYKPVSVQSGSIGRDSATYYLLDGQQRANAITLGYCDPHNDDVPAALWLDLTPAMEAQSGRTFLFRMTTEAHPWGYKKSDDTGPLSASKVRDALEQYGWMKEGKPSREGRPKPNETWPIDATTPIPFSWLIRDLSKEALLDPTSYWKKVLGCCEAAADKGVKWSWTEKVIGFLGSGREVDKKLEAIVNGLRRALDHKVLILEVPEDVLSSKDDLAKVEHLFQRLNAGGTPLGGEELAYSMVKAYWPDLKKPIEQLAKRRIPPSRLARMGAQIAQVNLSRPPDALPAALSVNRMRSIARSQNQTERESISSFIKKDLQSVLDLIESWLEDTGNNTIGMGLPPVLHTSVARNSPDVYLLLMWLARRALVKHGNLSVNATSPVRKSILGLVTALHWFGSDKRRSVASVYNTLRCEEELKSSSFKNLLRTVLKLEEDRIGLFPLPTPAAMEGLIGLPNTDAELRDWRWWKQARDESNKEHPERNEYKALQKIKDLDELLLYAQRTYLLGRFKDYDPARQDLWEQHNRPWDYDHILPRAKIKGTHGTSGIKEWASSIANLRAWPMEDNRSDQIISPAQKLNDHQSCTNSFITEDQLKGFEKGYEDVKDFSKANEFIRQAKERLCMIYGEWYVNLDIAFLMGDA